MEEAAEAPGLPELIWAASNGNLYEVKRYGSKDNVNESYRRAPNSYVATPLGEACARGHAEIVDFLIVLGADVNVKSHDSTPLHLASDIGHCGIVRTLLTSGASIEDTDWYGRTALQRAVDAGHHDVVETLLTSFADVNTIDDDGWTPLHTCRSGKMAKTLLNHGANVNARDSVGLTPLCRLSIADDDDQVPVLLDYGAGTGIICGLQHPGFQSTCTGTVLMCCYSLCHEQIFRNWLPSFEKHFIKVKLAGLPLHRKENPRNPSQCVEFTQSDRDAFEQNCLKELQALKTSRIGDSGATFFSLLSRNVSDLRGQRIARHIHSMSWDDVCREYPMYGNMLHCSFLALQRFLLTDQLSLDFFPMVHDNVLPECAEMILGYLPVRDLESVATVVFESRISSALHEEDNE